MIYKYYGAVPVTCYGITFRYGDVKEVPGIIELNNFMRADRSELKIEEEKPSPKLTQKRPVGRPPKSSEPNIVLDDNSSEEEKSEDSIIEKEKV